jgi:hypothetical protein
VRILTKLLRPTSGPRSSASLAALGALALAGLNRMGR